MTSIRIIGMILWCIIVVCAILGIGAYVLDRITDEPQWTYNVCCGGKACSDTYYDNATNECVLTQCVSNPLIENKTKCRYPSNFNGMMEAGK